MTDDSLKSLLLGLSQLWAENTPCNIHLHGFGHPQPKEGVMMWVLGQFNLRRHVADGIAMGTPGCVSLTSVISLLTQSKQLWVVTTPMYIGGCDKNMLQFYDCHITWIAPAIFLPMKQLACTR